jgi:hypothetical protein
VQLHEESVRPEAVGIVCSYSRCIHSWPPRAEFAPDVGLFRLTQHGRSEVAACHHSTYAQSLHDPSVAHFHDQKCGPAHLFDSAMNHGCHVLKVGHSVRVLKLD